MNEDEVKSLMCSDAYQDNFHPDYDKTQCMVRQAWENLYPDDDRNENPKNYYIWRCQSDDKVRETHCELDGKVFSWDNPPEVGHPGEDYN